VADSETEDALARSFLAELPAEVISELRAGGERADYPAGATVYQPGSEPRAALVVRGLLRVFLASLEGRQVTVRYARPGGVLGVAVLVGGPASVGCWKAPAQPPKSVRDVRDGAKPPPGPDSSLAPGRTRTAQPAVSRCAPALPRTSCTITSGASQRVAETRVLLVTESRQHGCFAVLKIGRHGGRRRVDQALRSGRRSGCETRDQ
jgi:hypothetical protein